MLAVPSTVSILLRNNVPLVAGVPLVAAVPLVAGVQFVAEILRKRNSSKVVAAETRSRDGWRGFPSASVGAMATPSSRLLEPPRPDPVCPRLTSASCLCLRAVMGGFEEGERAQSVSQGDGAVVPAPRIPSFPQPQVTWYRDGRKIPPSSRM